MCGGFQEQKLATHSQPIYVWEVDILLALRCFHQAAKETFLFYPFKPTMEYFCLRGHMCSISLNFFFSSTTLQSFSTPT